MNKTTTLKVFPFLVWGTATLFYFYQFVLQVSPSVMAKDLMLAFRIDAAGLGILVSCFLYIFAIMQIPVGIILDRFGAKRLLICSAVICSLGAFLFAGAHGFVVAAIGRTLIGLGASTATISCMYIASVWLPLELFSLFSGLLLAIGMAGAIAGEAPLSFLVNKFQWRTTMYILGAIGIGVTVLLLSVVRDRKNSSNNVKKVKLLEGLKSVIKCKQTWIASIYASLMYTPTLVFGSLWGVPFLITKYHLPKTTAASLVSLLFLGWIFGAPLFGWLSDYFRKRNLFMYINGIGSLIFMCIAIYLPMWVSHTISAIGIFGTGFFSSGFIVAFSVARESNTPENTGVAIGLMNGLNALGGAILSSIVGVILDHYSVVSAISYEVALTCLPMALLVATILLFWLEETKKAY